MQFVKKFTSIVDVFALNSNVGKQILILIKPRNIFDQNFCFDITRFKDKIRFWRSSTWLVRTYLYPSLLCAKLHFSLILTLLKGKFRVVFASLRVKTARGVEIELLLLLLTINRNGFLSFCNFFFKQEKVEYNNSIKRIAFYHLISCKAF